MIEYALLALIKILDNVVLTFKSVATYKEYKILSSILVIISQLIFYLVIDQVINDNTMLTIIIVSVSSGIGNYLAFALNSKFKKPTKWIFVLTTSNVDDVEKLCDYLVEHNIKYIVNDGYTRKWQTTKNVIAFSKTKEDSRLIENYLKNAESKYLKEII